MNITNFTLWKNKFKKAENQPDFIIRHKDEAGNWIDIGAGWKKEVKGKVDEQGKPVTYLSCQLKEQAPPMTQEQKDFIKKTRETNNSEKNLVNDALDNF